MYCPYFTIVVNMLIFLILSCLLTTVIAVSGSLEEEWIQ